MTLKLTRGTSPEGLEVKTFGVTEVSEVLLGRYEISMHDFCCAILYVLTNTNLGEDDPRRILVEKVKNLSIVVGWSGRGERFE